MKYLNYISGDISTAKLKDIEIKLNKRNLIITGKNGSGKTSFLNRLHTDINSFLTGQKFRKIEEIKNSIIDVENKLKNFSPNDFHYSFHKDQLLKLNEELQVASIKLNLEFEEENLFLHLYNKRKASVVFFPSNRITKIQKIISMTSIEVEKISAKDRHRENLGSRLEQHLLNIRILKSIAYERNELDKVKKIENWFKRFEDNLKFLLENNSVELIFSAEYLNFKIKQGEKEFSFQSLSSGYQAIFEILSDLIIRTEFFDTTQEEIEGIVIIDEIDVHLHISLQKKILRFFTDLFPQIQFIVSTHSPFVVSSSCLDTVVYDISTNELIEGDLSAYSYESIIEGLFHVETKSQKLFDTISSIINILENDKQNFIELTKLLNKLKPSLSQLDAESKVVFYNALNYLSDNKMLGDLDV